MKLQQYFFMFALICFLSACGFHLRGQGPNNFIGDFDGFEIYLAVSSENQAFLRQIKMDMQLAEFKLVEEPEKSSMHLIVLNTEFDKRVIGTDQNGRDNEFQIAQTAEFIVNIYSEDQTEDQSITNNSSSNSSEFETQSVHAHRNYYFDSNDPIGKKAEEEFLKESMGSELTRKMISHLIISLSKAEQSEFGVK